MDEDLVPMAQRLKIGRSNFRLLSDIKSKESTLQLFYDVLRRCPFFNAFLVTADKKRNEMYYPRFTKAIIHQYMSKDPSIPRRNKVNWHYVRNDFMFSMIKLVYRHQNAQQFDAMLPIELTNDEIRNSKAYKEYYAIARGDAAPKNKASVRRTRSSFDISITPPTAAFSPRPKAFAKGKQTAKASKANSLSALFEVAMTEAQQLKLVLKRSMQQTHISQPSGLGTDEGTGSKPRVLDVPTDESEEEVSWNSTDDEGDDNEGKDDEEDEGEESFDPIPQTYKDSEDESDGEEFLDLNIGEEERHDEEEDELYRDVNINQGRGLQGTLEVEDTHLTLTPVKPDGQQESSLVSSQFMTSMLNLTLDVGMESIFKTIIDVQTPTSVAPLPITTPTITSSTTATTTQTSQAPTLPTTIPSETNQFAGAVSAIPEIVQHYMDQRMNEAVQIAIQLQSDRLYEQSNLYKALVDAYESDKIILDTYRETVTLKRRHDDDEDKDEEPSAGPDRGSKKHIEGKEPESASTPSKTATKSAGRSTTGSKSRQASASESAFAEEPLRVDTLTPELLARPTYDLMKGSCKSLIEFEYHLEEVYKAKTVQLDWVNPKGQQYPHNLLQPLPLIPDNRGRCVIPFAHFINNDLEYLRGGASSQKYTMSVTKTKAADYRHGVSYWGSKRQQFYSFAVNWESARDVYSKRRIIVVTELKFMEWYSYKHLDWITIRRDNDKLYKFKEAYYKRLRIQDIKDMLLLLIQGKLTNLTRRMEDLQLGVESYQERLNLTKSDTYRSDMKRKEACTAYSDPRGFIYQNKDKRNRDSDAVSATNNLEKSDKDRAAAMIQAIDKRLKTRRIMRSLERFVGGRLYEGDFRMLQRTI
nr:hypothetical protein [Tanacetum cinerariifolium]